MIALVTAADVVDADLAPLCAAFGAAGAAAEIVAWDDGEVDWSRFDAIILRSTWDYAERLDDFLAWLRAAAAATRVVNAPAAVTWNIDKHYLAELAAAGVPIVPTTFVEIGAAVPELAADVDTWVVKPTVGASASGASRCARPAVAVHVASLHAAGHAAIVQPYLELIDDRAETSLVFFGGRDELVFDHAVRRGAVLAPGAAGPAPATEDAGSCLASVAERRLADRVLACAPVAALGALAYARVDVAPTPDGPVLMELELIEPSLYLGFDEGSADRAVAAWTRHLGNPRSEQ